MSPSPLGRHNHSQTHLKLSNRLLLQALVSVDLHTAKSLKKSLELGPFSLQKFQTCKALPIFYIFPFSTISLHRLIWYTFSPSSFQFFIFLSFSIKILWVTVKDRFFFRRFFIEVIMIAVLGMALMKFRIRFLFSWNGELRVILNFSLLGCFEVWLS